MANSLLDFVMSLVRDPDAAAQYAADPAQAIADAHLTDVSSVDVNNLIPVVAESMSTVVPSGGGAGGDALIDATHNVWASGAATAAFDAFDDHLPVQGGDWATGELSDQVYSVVSAVEQPESAAPTIADPGFDDIYGLDVPAIATTSDPSLGGDAPTYEDVDVDGSLDGGSEGASGTTDDHAFQPHDPDFDFFT